MSGYIYMSGSMSSKTNITFAVAAALPDGHGGFSPCPNVLTEDEAVRYLRLDTTGVKNPIDSLKNYIAEGALMPTRVGTRNRFTQKSLNEFLRLQTKLFDEKKLKRRR